MFRKSGTQDAYTSVPVSGTTSHSVKFTAPVGTYEFKIKTGSAEWLPPSTWPAASKTFTTTAIDLKDIFFTNSSGKINVNFSTGINPYSASVKVKKSYPGTVDSWYTFTPATLNTSSFSIPTVASNINCGNSLQFSVSVSSGAYTTTLKYDMGTFGACTIPYNVPILMGSVPSQCNLAQSQVQASPPPPAPNAVLDISSNEPAVTLLSAAPVSAAVELGTQENTYTQTFNSKDTSSMLHKIPLKNLKARTYHYRIITKNSDGQKYYSKDLTFKHGHWFPRFFNDFFGNAWTKVRKLVS
jgi:hypothetical protein